MDLCGSSARLILPYSSLENLVDALKISYRRLGGAFICLQGGESLLRVDWVAVENG
jgi:hypothetical protein